MENNDFQKEAEPLEEILSEPGFIVDKVNCKYGKGPCNSISSKRQGVKTLYIGNTIKTGFKN